MMWQHETKVDVFSCPMIVNVTKATYRWVYVGFCLLNLIYNHVEHKPLAMGYLRLILALQAARGCASKPGLPCVGLSFPAAVLGFRSRWSLKLAAVVRRLEIN